MFLCKIFPLIISYEINPGLSFEQNKIDIKKTTNLYFFLYFLINLF